MSACLLIILLGTCARRICTLAFSPASQGVSYADLSRICPGEPGCLILDCRTRSFVVAGNSRSCPGEPGCLICLLAAHCRALLIGSGCEPWPIHAALDWRGALSAPPSDCFSAPICLRALLAFAPPPEPSISLAFAAAKRGA